MDNEIKQGYKVVRKDATGRMFSCFAGQLRRDFEVEYSFDKWVSPFELCGPLAVLRDKIVAETFITANKMEGFWEIIPCQYAESEIKMLWFAFGKNKPSIQGTVFASKVMLKEVRPNE